MFFLIVLFACTCLNQHENNKSTVEYISLFTTTSLTDFRNNIGLELKVRASRHQNAGSCHVRAPRAAHKNNSFRNLKRCRHPPHGNRRNYAIFYI
uniref:Secreted protein n=1 Tax=Ixodes ricinus TaxID=34613 RepID=A0A6B0UHM2_IXORI